MNVIEHIEEMLCLQAKGYRFSIQRVDPATRVRIADTYATTLQEARTDASRGTTDCWYEIRDLFSGNRIERLHGSKEAHND